MIALTCIFAEKNDMRIAERVGHVNASFTFRHFDYADGRRVSLTAVRRAD